MGSAPDNNGASGQPQDRLLQALVIGPQEQEDFTLSGPPILVEMTWLASRDRVEVSAFDARKPPTELPFYSETAEKVKDAEELWEFITGSSIAWRTK